MKYTLWASLALLIIILGGVMYVIFKNDPRDYARVKDFTLRQLRQRKALVAGVMLVVFAMMLSNYLYIFAQQKTEDWFMFGTKYSRIVSLKQDSLREGSQFRSMLHVGPQNTVHLQLPTTTNCRIRRMFEQLTDVSLKAFNHLATAREFMVQSFVCYSMSSIFYTLAFAILVFVSKSGWEKTESWLIVMLILSTAIATLFVGFSTIFKQEQNANANLDLYVRHINLEQQMRSDVYKSPYVIRYLQTDCLTALKDSAATAQADTLIVLYDKQMARINRIELGFDGSGVNKLRESLSASQPDLSIH